MRGSRRSKSAGKLPAAERPAGGQRGAEKGEGKAGPTANPVLTLNFLDRDDRNERDASHEALGHFLLGGRNHLVLPLDARDGSSHELGRAQPGDHGEFKRITAGGASNHWDLSCFGEGPSRNGLRAQESRETSIPLARPLKGCILNLHSDLSSASVQVSTPYVNVDNGCHADRPTLAICRRPRCRCVTATKLDSRSTASENSPNASAYRHLSRARAAVRRRRNRPPSRELDRGPAAATTAGELSLLSLTNHQNSERKSGHDELLALREVRRGVERRTTAHGTSTHL